MAYNYELTSSKVKVRSVVFGFDKRTGTVFAEFEYYGKDWSTGSPYPQAKLQSDLSGNTDSGSYTDKTVQDLTLIGNFWSRHKLTWNAGSVLSAKNWGEHDIKLIIHDEDDNAETFTQGVKIDLDPNEFYLTNTTSDFGDDSTPDITWKLNDLFSEQKMSPVITVGSSTANSMTVTFDDDTTVSGLSSGYINLNGVKFTESSFLLDSADAGIAYFKNAKEFKITSPTMSSGQNTYTLSLNCTAI